jgi:hypothetical protein
MQACDEAREPGAIDVALRYEANRLEIALSPDGGAADEEPLGRSVGQAELERVAGTLFLRAEHAPHEHPRGAQLDGFPNLRVTVDVLIAEQARRGPSGETSFGVHEPIG